MGTKNLYMVCMAQTIEIAHVNIRFSTCKCYVYGIQLQYILE
jgi:hypothetical protein